MKSRFAVFTWSLLAAADAFASTTNDLSDAEIQGRQLAQQLLEQQPAEDVTNTGVMQIRDAKGSRPEIPVRFQIVAVEPNSPNWLSSYQSDSNEQQRQIRRLFISQRIKWIFLPDQFRRTSSGAW